MLVVNGTTNRVCEMEDSATSSILLIAKIGAMIGLGFGSLALGALPLMVGLYRTKQLKKRRRAVSSHSSTSTSTSVSNASSSSVDSAPAAGSQVRPGDRQPVLGARRFAVSPESSVLCQLNRQIIRERAVESTLNSRRELLIFPGLACNRCSKLLAICSKS